MHCLLHNAKKHNNRHVPRRPERPAPIFEGPENHKLIQISLRYQHSTANSSRNPHDHCFLPILHTAARALTRASTVALPAARTRETREETQQTITKDAAAATHVASTVTTPAVSASPTASTTARTTMACCRCVTCCRFCGCNAKQTSEQKFVRMATGCFSATAQFNPSALVS